MTASVTHGRALRYAQGSARGLLHHVLGHCLVTVVTAALGFIAALILFSDRLQQLLN